MPGHGGAGQRFDWTYLKNVDLGDKTMIAGGLTPDNVADLLAIIEVESQNKEMKWDTIRAFA